MSVCSSPARAAASASAVSRSPTPAETAGERATMTMSHAARRGMSGRIASRSILRTLFRTTAPPIRRPTASPTRGPASDSSGASRAKWYRTNSGTDARRPDLRTRSKSALDLRRCAGRMRSACRASAVGARINRLWTTWGKGDRNRSVYRYSASLLRPLARRRRRMARPPGVRMRLRNPCRRDRRRLLGWNVRFINSVFPGFSGHVV